LSTSLLPEEKLLLYPELVTLRNIIFSTLYLNTSIMSTQAQKANDGLDLIGKTAVIAGGSQGIGTSVDKFLLSYCSQT
jgi:hypothetical protein